MANYKIKLEDCQKILELLDLGKSQKEIAELFNITQVRVSQIKLSNGLDSPRWHKNKQGQLCERCYVRKKTRIGSNKSTGKVYYASVCSGCRKHKSPRPLRHSHCNYKKPHCELCGFIAMVPAQLDLDHIDGNRNNYASQNLQTLCANCHRLKTYLARQQGKNG